MSGYLACVSITLPIASLPFSLAASRHAEALGVHARRRPCRSSRRRLPWPWADRTSELMKRDHELDLRVRFLRAGHEGVHQPVHLGDRVAADHADLVASWSCRRRPCRSGRPAPGCSCRTPRSWAPAACPSEPIRNDDLRVVLGDLARRRLDRERLADDRACCPSRRTRASRARSRRWRRSRRTRTRSRRAPSAAFSALWMRLTHCCSTGTV